jgi:uncharacterized protein
MIEMGFTMKFLNRTEEMKRLTGLLKGGGLGVVWGRRRVGKTRLLLEWVRECNGTYIVTDQSASIIQRRIFAEAVSKRFRGFADVEYPDWNSLLGRLAREARATGWHGPLVIDELPYLALSSPELPSVLQRWVDHEMKDASLTTVLAGSSQRMMQGLVMDAASPLYGRARENFSLKPLTIAYIQRAFPHIGAAEAVGYYSILGGIPRYWELASECGQRHLADIIDSLILNPMGPLHLEPDRLLLEENPPAQGVRSLLDVIGLGANRLSEIAARLQTPATALARPLSRLIEMEIVTRETPFGESEKSGKRSLYRISDPFFRFWFRVVAPYRAFLLQASSSGRKLHCDKHVQFLLAITWEELCRRSVARLGDTIDSLKKSGPWRPAQRYWKAQSPEWDVVSVSFDNKKLLLGEVKWHSKGADERGINEMYSTLLKKGLPAIPGIHALDVHHVLFVPTVSARKMMRYKNATVVDAESVISCFS